MHHLHNHQQVVLVEFLQALGQLVHINLRSRSVSVLELKVDDSYVLVSALLLLGALFTSRATLGLHAVLIAGNGTRLTQSLKESRLGVLEGLSQCTSPVRLNSCHKI